MNAMVTIRPATSADAEVAATVLAEAFRDDPAWSMSLPDPATRPQRLEAYYRRQVRRHPERIDIAEDAGRVVGALIWAAPVSGSRAAAVQRTLRRGLRRIASRLPGGQGIRHELAVAELKPTEPHWYLGDIGASPAARGKGVGSALLTHFVGRADASDTPLAALEATSQGSRRLYERFGFEAVGQVPTRPGEASTVMVRRPD
ncbi:GCN5 family N-acetyltransferase [Dietzia sp. NCCP-2495]|nr:GCN5 family N-acetyltransferase [Dietzia sp. NCCP-2495]